MVAAWLDKRLRRFGYILTREWLLWTLVAVFTARLIFFGAVNADRPDASALLAAAHDLLFRPGHIYTTMAQALAQTGTLAAPGHGFASPPGVLLLVAPIAILPARLGITVWTLTDAVAVAAGLLLLYRAIRPTGWRRPLFFLVAAYFPPVFAEIDAGQIGGLMFFLTAAAFRMNQRGRTGWAGILAGLAAAIKIYPAAVLFGVGPRRLRALATGLVLSAAALTLAAFARTGFGTIGFYVSKVLLPSLGAPLVDCGIASPHTLLGRTLGGDEYAVINASGGLTYMQSPLRLHVVAELLTALLLATLVAIAIWAAWRSGWHALYGPSLGFALGALVPSEVFVYQMLPMLPLVLVTGVRAAERGAYAVLGLLALPLLALLRQPCYLPFPDLWSLAMLALFAICAWNWRLFLPDVTAGPSPR